MDNNNVQDMYNIMESIGLYSLVNGNQRSTLYGLAWFNAQYRDTAIYIDVGTYNGCSAIVMASALKHQKLSIPQKVYTVDNYNYDNYFFSHYSYDHIYYSKQAIIEKIKDNFSHFCIDDIIEFHVEDDIEFIQSLPDHSIDMVFDDSGHNYEHTLNRLRNYIPKMNDNSLIVCHDYYVDGYSVIKAIKDFEKEFPHIVTNYGVIEGMYCGICNLTIRT